MMNISKISHKGFLGGALKSIAVVVLLANAHQVMAQDNPDVEKSRYKYGNYGNVFNIGIGPGYYGYLQQDVPFLFVNYEFRLAHNFTIAPFIGFSSYRANDYYYRGSGYYYQETVVPMGAKVAYYFNELFQANPNWDFYAAASLGFVIDHVAWEDGYTGDAGAAHTASPLYLDAHIGAKYHFTRKVAVFADLSTGVSTIGLAVKTR